MQSRTSKSAAVAFSGGQDSATSLLWALRNFEDVVAFSFDYGQKHRVELQFAEQFAKKYGVSWATIPIQGIFQNSSLLNGGDHSDEHRLNPSLPASFVPGRNILFLAALAARASALGITTLVTGVCETDYSGYPDCRRETIDALEKTLTLGMGVGEVKIETPLMYLDKSEIWRMAQEMDAVEDIVTLTMTDYNGDMTLNDWGFGREDNPASILRANGYREALRKGWLR